MNRADRKIGVWLDHTKAHFVDISKGPAGIETVYSDKESHLRFKGEHGIGTKLGNNRSTNREYEQHKRAAEIMHIYYKVLVDRLKDYDDIYLFGPGPAKDEFWNLLKGNKHFAAKTINAEPSEQLTENQLIARVKKFYNL